MMGYFRSWSRGKVLCWDAPELGDIEPWPSRAIPPPGFLVYQVQNALTCVLTCLPGRTENPAGSQSWRTGFRHPCPNSTSLPFIDFTSRLETELGNVCFWKSHLFEPITGSGFRLIRLTSESHFLFLFSSHEIKIYTPEQNLAPPSLINAATAKNKSIIHLCSYNSGINPGIKWHKASRTHTVYWHLMQVQCFPLNSCWSDVQWRVSRLHEKSTFWRHNEETNTTLSCAPLLGCFIITVSQFHLLYTCSLYLMSGRGIHKDGSGVSFTVMGRWLASQVNRTIKK